jgi:cysteinyl-tRNA synthetase
VILAVLRSKNEYRESPRKLTVYNSLGGEKEIFNPLDHGPQPTVLMYVCGLTPQDSSHLGHGLMAIRFDMVRRYLEYRRLTVNFVQNVTDIDDKIINKTVQLGVDPIKMTQQYTEEFYQQLDKLHVLPVCTLTKVTEFVPQIIAYITVLLEKGFAYATSEGNVYFDVAKRQDYGKLSNQNTSMLYESVRKELDKDKHSPLDFALWKRDDSTVLSQPSPWGVGRPGWHIECSVMCSCVLGNRIDIHGGGLDLKFPHHENEIAQSESYSGDVFANVWMHSGLLNIDGQKMSKSLNNFVPLVDAVEQYGAAPLRFVIARHHYRSAVDLTDKLFRDNLNSLLDFHRLFERVLGDSHDLPDEEMCIGGLQDAFEASMDNDFGSPEAMVAIEAARNELLQLLDSGAVVTQEIRARVQVIRALGNILGVFFDSLQDIEAQGLRLMAKILKAPPLSPDRVREVLEERALVRSQKNFARSDELRKELADQGVEVLDSKAGSSWRFA